MKKVYLLILCLAMVSCSQKIFLKRKYTSGIFLETRKAASGPILHPRLKMAEAEIKMAEENDVEILGIENSISNDVDGFAEEIAEKNEKPVRKPLDQNCGDELWLRESGSVRCKVIEISESQVKYKTCGTDGQTMNTVSLSKVSKIRFQNGAEEVFNLKEKKKEKRADRDSLQGENFAMLGYVLVIIGGLIAMLTTPALGLFLLFFSVLPLILIFARKCDLGLRKFLIVIGCIISGLALLGLALLIAAIILLLAMA